MLNKIEKYACILSLIIAGINHTVFADSSDSTSLLKIKKRTLVFSEIGIGVATHTLLYSQWYRNYPMGQFHFFDDSKEWLQMDKFGHCFSAYYLTVMGHQAGLMVGYNNKQAALNGLILGFTFQTAIEVMDGFSAYWGASVSDLTANMIGSTLAYTQARKWGEQKIIMKWSYTPTDYAPLRPNLLGNGFFQEFLKDYNGQSYWLSFNMASLTGVQSKYLPEWLNLELGYGANGMIGGYGNKWTDSKTGIHYDYSHIPRYRQFYLSAGLDWVKLIKPKNQWGKIVLTALNCFKFPFPALEYNTLNHRIQGHYLKF